jgi:osmotically inducible lipoprotein OsmB
MTRIASIAITTLLILSACGTNPGERALSGAGIGAAGGAVVGAVAGDPLAGAVIGGAGGAAVGALTSPRQVYLGRPAWK